MSAPARWPFGAILREVAAAVPLLARRFAASRLGRGTTTGVAALVLDADGRLLLVRVSYRRGWALPGGFLDRGEDPAAGAARELAEETGLAVGDALAGLGTVDGPGRNHRTHVFGVAVASPGPALSPPRPWEIRAAGWFAPAELPPLHPMVGVLLEPPAGLLARHGDRFALP